MCEIVSLYQVVYILYSILQYLATFVGTEMLGETDLQNMG